MLLVFLAWGATWICPGILAENGSAPVFAPLFAADARGGVPAAGGSSASVELAAKVSRCGLPIARGSRLAPEIEQDAAVPRVVDLVADRERSPPAQRSGRAHASAAALLGGDGDSISGIEAPCSLGTVLRSTLTRRGCATRACDCATDTFGIPAWDSWSLWRSPRRAQRQSSNRTRRETNRVLLQHRARMT